eukprot:2462173-Heterocapsa_arctica.AAC.1
MNILYGARLTRFDVLRAVGALATSIMKWKSKCDPMLHRLVCCIHYSYDMKQKGYISDPADKLQLTLYSDADFAGCPESAKSTS